MCGPGHLCRTIIFNLKWNCDEHFPLNKSIVKPLCLFLDYIKIGLFFSHSEVHCVALNHDLLLQLIPSTGLVINILPLKTATVSVRQHDVTVEAG